MTGNEPASRIFTTTGRCTYLLFLTLVVAIGLLPISWFGYQWYASPVYPAFVWVRWAPLIAWAILADVGVATRIAIFALPWVALVCNGPLTGQIQTAVAAMLIVGTARLVGVRLKCPASLVPKNASRRQFSIADLLMSVAGIAAALKATDALWWNFGYLPNYASLYRYRGFEIYWTRIGGFEFTLMTSIWLVSLACLILASGSWRASAVIPAGGILAILFHREEAAIRDGYFRIVSWEHPAVMSLEFFGTQVLFVAVSLLVIRWCGYRLCWVRSFPRRMHTRIDQHETPASADSSADA
jgi:hypothetical protein